MMKFTTVVPKFRNDGSPVPPEELDAIIERIWQQFGGATVEGEVTGHWVDRTDGTHYRDLSLRVSVACERERLAEAQEAVRQIGRQLGQKAMYFEVQGYDGVQILRTE